MKVGDRNSTVGWTQSNLGHLEGHRRKRVGSAEHGLQFLPQRQRPVEHVQFVLQQRAQFRQSGAPFHQRRGDQADHEGDAGADRGHDQNRRHRAGNPAPLQKAGGRRQHGADHEGRHDRKEEGLGDIENGDDADHQQRDQREGHHLGAADHRRLFGFAVRQRRADRALWRRTLVGKDTQLALPRATVNVAVSPRRRRLRIGLMRAQPATQRKSSIAET